MRHVDCPAVVGPRPVVLSDAPMDNILDDETASRLWDDEGEYLDPSLSAYLQFDGEGEGPDGFDHHQDDERQDKDVKADRRRPRGAKRRRLRGTPTAGETLYAGVVILIVRKTRKQYRWLHGVWPNIHW